MWFDSHCHLHICEEDRPVEEVIAEARAAGVTEMLTVGFDLESNPRAVELAANEGVYASVGIHPNSSSGWDDDSAGTFEPFLSRPEVVAIGEVAGTDRYPGQWLSRGAEDLADDVGASEVPELVGLIAEARIHVGADR